MTKTSWDLEPGSPEWCKQRIRALKSTWRHDVLFRKDWQRQIDEANEHGLWKRYPATDPYGSYDEFLRIECRTTRQEVTDRARLQAQNIPRKGGRPSKETSTNSRRSVRAQGPDTRERLLRRLARDHPKILAQFERGEFPSARAAGIAAGIVKVPTVLDQLRKLWKKATPREKRSFRSETL